MAARRSRLPTVAGAETAHRRARSEARTSSVTTDGRRREMTSRCFLVVIIMCAVAAPAYADDDAAPPPVRIRFIPRYDFHLSADRLSSGDARFIWDTNFGGEVDLLDYAVGRATFTGNFESVLGNQFRNFDPNQGNYLLDSSLSLREHGTEAAALFHHTSRHLSDRFKRAPVAWNMFGVRVQRAVAA